MKVKNIFAIMTMAAVVGTTAMVSCNKDDNTTSVPGIEGECKDAYVTVNVSILPQPLQQIANFTVTKQGNKFKIVGTTDTVQALQGPFSFEILTEPVTEEQINTTDDGVNRTGTRYKFEIKDQPISVPGFGDILFSGDNGQGEVVTKTKDGASQGGVKIFSFSVSGELPGNTGTVSISVNYEANI
ncbi:hypothetical protein FACS1894156_0600 [Bacteroidia bacterium]|nr:hypothetical protein FACS1894156_0600 [Bacteroidia bacterium]